MSNEIEETFVNPADYAPVTEAELAAAAVKPRITPDHIVGLVKQEDYIDDGLLTVCVIRLRNGFKVVGQSACARIENYNQKIGERLAREDALSKIWPLEDYLLCERIYDGSLSHEHTHAHEQPDAGLDAVPEPAPGA